MKSSLILAAVVFCTLGLTAQKTVINDPNAVQRTVQPFSAISVSDAIDLYLVQSDVEAVAVSASETKYRDKIRTSVENGELKIWYDREGWSLRSGNRKLKAYVSFKSIQKLSASGASDVVVDGAIKADNLRLELSGASDFKGRVELGSLNVHQSGASDCSISGTAVNLQVDASGASDLKGYDLLTDNCKAEASGASDIKITVNRELNASVSGASSVLYRGSGVIKDVKKSGASSVNKTG